MAGKKQSYERHEQAALVAWFRLRYPNELLFAIPNGGYRNMLEAIAFKKAGVVPGIPDLFLASPRGMYAGMFIEMKRIKGGRVSEAQATIANLLRDKGYLTIVGAGWDDAKIQIEGYMQGAPWMAQLI